MLENEIYQIPHNFRNNGRIFNIISKEALTKVLIWLIPVTIIIFKFTSLSIDNKFFVAIIIGAPPAMAFAFEMDIVLMDIIKYLRNRKVYYNLGEVKKGENNRHYQGAYERAKKQQIANKGKR